MESESIQVSTNLQAMSGCEMLHNKDNTSTPPKTHQWAHDQHGAAYDYRFKNHGMMILGIKHFTGHFV